MTGKKEEKLTIVWIVSFIQKKRKECSILNSVSFYISQRVLNWIVRFLFQTFQTIFYGVLRVKDKSMCNFCIPRSSSLVFSHILTLLLNFWSVVSISSMFIIFIVLYLTFLFFFICVAIEYKNSSWKHAIREFQIQIVKDFVLFFRRIYMA